MKKKIIVGLLMVSALSFGAMNDNSKNINNSGQKGIFYTQTMNNLSEKQQIELTKLMRKKRKDNYKKSLDIKSKELKLEKMLVEDKINWKGVETTNKKISEMKANQRLENIKFKNNVETKYGISISPKRMKENDKSMGEKHMRKGINNDNNNNNKNKGDQRGTNDNKRMNKNDEKGPNYNKIMNNLLEKQQIKLTKMMGKKRKDNYKKSLDIKTKELKLEKLLIEDEINWKGVEKVNGQISEMKAEQRLENMKFKNKLETKYGISIRYMGKRMDENHMNGGNGYKNK